MLFAIVFFFAQVYGCGGYGAVSYNQCPVSSTSQSSSAINNSAPAAASTPGASPQQSSGQASPTQTTSSTTANSGPSLIVGLAHMDYGTLLILAFCGALLIAALLFIIRLVARKRKQKQKNQPTQF